MAISFDKAPLGLTLSHVTPTGATHSSAFHTIASCFVNNRAVSNNVTVKVEVYNSLSDYNAGKPQIDDLRFTFTLLKNAVSGKGKLQTVTRRDDILVQAYNQLMTLNAPDGSSTNYSGVQNDLGATEDNDTRKGNSA
jgi:phosphosulfolactate phosphohydrolase-like enzyme